MSKYHNFKYAPAPGAGYYYFSKCGHASNDNTNPNTPKSNPVGLTSNITAVIGAGHYNGSGAVNTSSNTTVSAYADGKVILENYSFMGMFPLLWIGFTFLNCKMRFRENYMSNSRNNVFIDCELNTSVSAPWGTGNNNVFINCTGQPVRMDKSVLRNVRLFGPTINTSSYAANCDIDRDSLFVIEHTAPVLGSFNNNNMRGLLRLPMLDGTYRDYAIKDQLTGTPQDNGYAVGVAWVSTAQLTADGYKHNAAGWDAIAAGNINRPPKFNDAAGQDFTYAPDSPNLRRATDGTNIGGQEVAVSIMNTDNGNAEGTIVAPSAAIDTSVPNALQLKAGEAEGYVDYVFYNSGRTITNLDLKDVFNFNSDIAGGQIGNRNVADAEPVTAEYPLFVSTTAAAAALNQLVVASGKIAVGKHVRVLGECREVISIAISGANATLTLNANLRALVGAGVEVCYGSVLQLAAINPNRLTVFMRTRSVAETPSWPLVNADWDNGLDAVYGKAGWLFNQEINAKPLLYIDGTQVYGGGDSDAPVGLAPQEIAAHWVHIRAYKRNNYTHRGLPG